MPRIAIEYDSDSDFERNYLEMATHEQILTRYQMVKNDEKLALKEKEEMLKHAVEKCFLALKRAEIKLAKANETVAELNTKLELESTEAALKLQLDLERVTNLNCELRRELLVYEGVLPPYLDTKSNQWIMDRQMKWTKENREMREMREAQMQLAQETEKSLSLTEKTHREITRLTEENLKMKSHLEDNQRLHTMQNAMAPNHIVKLAEENMVLRAKWEKGWELTAERRKKQKAIGLEEQKKKDELENEGYEMWKERKRKERQAKEREGQRWRDRDADVEIDGVERAVMIRGKGRPSL